MVRGRRRLLQTIATLGTLSTTGCLDSLRGGEGTDTADPAEQENSTSTTGTEQADLAATAETLARTVFAEQAYEQATAQFTEQAQRLFTPVYFEQVRRGATAIGGSFQSVTGTATQSTGGLASVTLDLAFSRSPGQFTVTGDPAALTRAILDGAYRSPAYADEQSFETKTVTLEAAADCSLPGTLALPEQAESVPGAVIVPGDGNIDQDFATGGTATYRDLAEGLASAGIATLRYDKRTLACDRTPSTTTLDEEVTDDALTAIERLRTTDGVDPDRIVAIGHSLGGMVVPRLAARDDPLAGIVGLATPARPLHELVISQTEHLIEILDNSDQLEAQLPTLEAAAERVAAGEYTDDERVLGRTGSFWASLQSYDHLETAADLSTQQLYCQGGRDFQVDPEADFRPLQEQLGDAPASFTQYPGLNHRFMPTAGPSLATEYRMPNNVSEQLIDDLAGWITGLA